MSTETLVRGVNLLRNSTMSLDNDPAYQEMVAERDRLRVPYMNWQQSWFSGNHYEFCLSRKIFSIVYSLMNDLTCSRLGSED